MLASLFFRPVETTFVAETNNKEQNLTFRHNLFYVVTKDTATSDETQYWLVNASSRGAAIAPILQIARNTCHPAATAQKPNYVSHRFSYAAAQQFCKDNFLPEASFQGVVVAQTIGQDPQYCIGPSARIVKRGCVLFFQAALRESHGESDRKPLTVDACLYACQPKQLEWPHPRKCVIAVPAVCDVPAGCKRPYKTTGPARAYMASHR